MIMKKKTFYYKDELNDDFAPTRDLLSGYTTPSDFQYLPANYAYRVLSSALYRCATPIASLWCRLYHGVVIHNRRAVFSVPSGFFLYGNHTQSVCDAFLPTLISFPRRSRIVTSPNSVATGLLRTLVPMLGGLPLPSDIRGARRFLNAMQTCVEHGESVTIYPEAHVWPYYNKIRPFPADSFSYPARMKVPVIAFVVTYRRPPLLQDARPLISVTLSDPILPKNYTNARELRDRVYSFMQTTAEEKKSVARYDYEKTE